MSASRHVIVGAGLAGAKAAQSLRREGHDGPITLVGAEAVAPYNRPPLSKEYLEGLADRDALGVLRPGWYAAHDVELLLSSEATDIDLDDHVVRLATGVKIGYDKLLLATGSRARRLSIDGSDLDAVHYLRTADDSDGVRRALGTASRVVLIGAGWVGLEIAAAARRAGVEVTVLETLALPLVRVLGPEVAQHFAALHLSHGVDLRCGVEPAAITGRAGRATGVELSDGSHVAADAVIVGIGASPRTELAQRAGLAVDGGILVDAQLRSSHEDVFAAGDVAAAWHPVLHQRVRVEHWSNAAWQPRVAARAMLGSDAVYDKLPYVFSDQYDVFMEYIGHVGPAGYDHVVLRGDPTSQSYVAFWLRDGALLAGMSVNTPGMVRDITSLIGAARRVDPADLADGAHPLGSLSRPDQ